MTREEVYVRLNDVFREVFDDEELEVNDETTSDDIEDWDSLEHINLVAAIEKEFDVKFTMAQIMGFENVGEMVDCILEQ
ncbi:MAG: acyl carrier protein [Lachnospiraceae bacterium]|nr:acyl carrier protein [Lachnospiraceae bacterium]